MACHLLTPDFDFDNISQPPIKQYFLLVGYALSYLLHSKTGLCFADH